LAHIQTVFALLGAKPYEVRYSRMNMSATNTAPVDTIVQDEMARGIASAQAGDRAGAHKIFQSLAERNAQMPEVWVWLGGTSSILEDAEAAFQHALALDPVNEEANLGLRWAALRRQIMGQAGAADLSTGVFDNGNTATVGLPSGSLANSSLGGDVASGAVASQTPQTAEPDKAATVKGDKAGGRRMKIPPAAIILFALAFILYAIVAWYLIFQWK
jgi:hypothetical protein